MARIHSVHYLRAVRLELGGVVRAVLDICAGLAARGHRVTLLTSDTTDIPPQWKSGGDGVPQAITIAVPAPLSSIPAEAGASLADADVLHLHTPWELANLPLAKAATRRGIPYLVTLHGMLDEWSIRQKWLKKRAFLAVMGRRLLRRAAVVHCTAEAEVTQGQRYFRAGSGRVVPLPVDLRPYESLPGPQQALRELAQLQELHPRLLLLSRLNVGKGPELLIEAAALLHRNGIRAGVVIAGPGDPEYLAQLRQLAETRGLGGYVLFPGMVRGQSKTSLFQSADVFVLPSSHENFGLVLIEALACGTPVITTRGVNIWAELQQAGALIVERDASQIAAAIQELLAEPQRGRQLGMQGRSWVLDRLAPDRVIAEYERMYAAAMQGS